MASWMSNLVAGPHAPSMEERLVNYDVRFTDEELEEQECFEDEESYVLVDIRGEPIQSDSGRPTPEQSLYIETVEQRNEEPRNDSRPDNENHEKEFKSGRQFACWSAGISFAGVMTMIGVRAANLPANINRKPPFYICSTSLASAFISSLLLLLFTSRRPVQRNPATIIRCIECLIVGLLILVVGFGLAMIY